MNTYDWADSLAAFEMARENKTHYLHELENPSMKAKLIATALRRESEELNAKLREILRKLQILTTE